MENLNKPCALVIDDNILNREILSDVLCDTFDILLACDGKEGIEQLEKHHKEISVVLLDLVMPNVDGFGVLQAVNDNDWLDDFPILIISSDVTQENITHAYDMGVSDYIARPFIEAAVKEKVGSVIKAFAKQQYLIKTITDSVIEREKNSNMMVEILSAMVEYRNGESGAHVKHISIITNFLLHKLNEKSDLYNFSEEDIELICLASSFHDIGKIAIPSEILNKPGKLTDEEFAIMKTHSEEGFKMVESIGMYENEKLVKYIRDITYCHHEKYDGRGYPRHLVGEEIPIWAQVVSVADVYDALTSQRCYKPAFTHEKAIDMIIHGECGMYSDLLISCLLECAEDIREGMHTDVDVLRDKNIKERIRSILAH